MEPDVKRIYFYCSLILIVLGTNNIKLFAGEPGYTKLPETRPFYVTAGFGYGVSNNPCRNCNEPNKIGGPTFSFSLGYKINEKFKIEFGPSFWLEADDLGNKNVAARDKPNNKRTLVTFTGNYQPLARVPLFFRLGGGVGLLNYTPEIKTVKTDEQKFDDTEIFKGFSGIAGVAYEIKLCSKLIMYPSLNFWYIHFDTPEIKYNSYIDPSKPSLTGDARITFRYDF